MRPSHFHSGIDIKGYVGQPLLAAADAYVWRIKVQSGGYGKVLYLKHPNGYSTVYAHMDRFDEQIEKYVKKEQYSKKKYEIELYPSPDQFVFSKGDQIGKMGVSGHSFGPHVHFEIRDSKSEKPINPLLFGLPVADNISPRLHQVKVYNLNPSLETRDSKILDLVKSGSIYRISRDTLVYGAWRVGLGLKVYDHMDGVSNWNGVYSIEMLVDGTLIYDFDMETFSFLKQDTSMRI